MLKRDFVTALNNPSTDLSQYAHVLAAVEQRDGHLSLTHRQKFQVQPTCNSELTLPIDSLDASTAIMCRWTETETLDPWRDLWAQAEAFWDLPLGVDRGVGLSCSLQSLVACAGDERRSGWRWLFADGAGDAREDHGLAGRSHGRTRWRGTESAPFAGGLVLDDSGWRWPRTVPGPERVESRCLWGHCGRFPLRNWGENTA
jgi:hypothetical protein